VKNILIINGSLGGATGNTSVLIEAAQKAIEMMRGKSQVIHLENETDILHLKEDFKNADGFIFTTGTYWDSWGSPLQKFLESATEFEAEDIFLFKPAAVLITMHSVGGKGVLSRLQGVLNTFGLSIPPMSGLVYSLSTHLASESKVKTSFSDDFWSLEDVKIVVHNLMTAVEKKDTFKAWPVDKKDPKRRWL
jgi:NAD(P)H-dependent FMN reductase